MTRIGIAKTNSGAEGYSGIVDTKWVPLQTFDPQSEESEIKFSQLCKFDADQRMSSGCELQNKKDYGNTFAPVYCVEDFSTASLLRNAGESLTGEKLSVLTPHKMIEKILQKAGVIHLTRLYRILEDACAISKLQLPSVNEVVDYMQKWAYVLAEEQLFIARAELMFEQSPRKRALWQYLVFNLIKGPIKLSNVWSATCSDY